MKFRVGSTPLAMRQSLKAPKWKKAPKFLTNKILLFVKILVKTQLLAKKKKTDIYKSLCGLCYLTIRLHLINIIVILHLSEKYYDIINIIN